MKNKLIILSVWLLLMGFSNSYCFVDYIERDKDRWKIFYADIAPIQNVKQWKLPFKTKNRTDLSTISVISTFASNRMSYVKDHYHSGVDIVPKKNGGQYIYVYPMAPGVVCSIHLGDPHRTVVVKHKLTDGDILYTSYKHFQEVFVTIGQHLSDETPLARLYTRSEAISLGGRYDHLHLEIRKKFDDYGVASWATMTKEDLDMRFHNPWIFMKENIK